MPDFIYKTRIPELLRYYIGKLLHTRNTKSTFDKKVAKVEIAGALHGLNIGDNALGKSIGVLLEENQIDYFYSNIYNISYTAKAKYLIVCGGATGTNDNIINIYQKYNSCPENVAFIGMDWEGEIHHLQDKVKNWLKKCHCISSRSKVWQNYLADVLSQSISKYHLDNVFSWLPNENVGAVTVSNGKTIGINMMSFYMQLDKYKNFVPGHGRASYLKENNPKQYDAIPQLGKWYVDLFKDLIDRYTKLGYKVVHIPFAIEDDLFARTVLKECKVKCIPFKDLNSTLSVLNGLEMMIASRYHALVFALSLQIPCKAFLYCNKSVDLYNELELSDDGVLSIFDLVNKNHSKIETFINSETFINIEPSILQRIWADTKTCISKNLNLHQWIK